jgi:reactive intermediate/imine deaminase
MNKILNSLVLVLGIVSASHAEEVRFYTSSAAQAAELPFSEAVRVGDILYLSGQLGALPGEMTVVPGGIVPEARQTLKNIRNTLEANGLGMSDVVKCTVMLADISEWGIFNEVYKEFFSKPYPARSAFATNGLALGARAELECMAVFKS